jgi:hypothetical protein
MTVVARRWMLLGLVLLSLVACRPREGGETTARVQGVVTTPIEDTYVFVYKADQDIYGPAFAKAGPTGSDGAFSLTLPPGRYLFVSRKRETGDAGGPVVSGDYRSKPMGPVEVKAGQKLDLSFLAEKKTGESKTLPTREQTETKTGISGRILDAGGNPVPKARVHVYTYVQMSERPKYVSNETGPDGKYMVFLPEGGTYYLAARNKFGGPPKLGDLYGRYEDGTIDPSGVVVHNGEILKDINITVQKVW